MIKYITVLTSMLLFSCTEKTSFLDYSTISNDSIFVSYNNFLNDVNSFYGEATLNTSFVQNGKAESFDVSADIVWNPRDSFAIQTSVTIFAVNVFDLFIGKHSFVTKMRDQYLRGLNDDTFLQQLTKIKVPLNKWPSFFLGHLNFEESYYKTQLMEDGRKRFVFKNKEIYFRNDALLPSEINFYDTNDIKIQQYRTMGSIKVGKKEFPKTIILTNFKDQSEVLINYSKIEINGSIDKKHFEVKIPSQMEQINYE